LPALGNLSTLIAEPIPPDKQLEIPHLNWFFLFFFLSGFCSVLYELVWLRASMAQFGVTTAMVSIVLSVFMAGLGLGSWASGRWLGKTVGAKSFSALRTYALIELLISVSGIAVSYELLLGRRILEHSGLSSSAGYYVLAGLWVTISLLPWCTLMGATVPVAMQAIAQTIPAESRRSFSYLYSANVGGAVFGTLIPLFLIELLGFRGTLKVGVACNALIALSALALSRKLPQTLIEPSEPGASEPTFHSGGGKILALLFLSGLTCMAMEVVWVRSYTPYYGTVVYSFASILGVYLLATFIGAVLYRRWSARWTEENPVIWSVLAACALLPLVATSPAFRFTRLERLVLGVTLFTGLLGFITPMLVDRFSGGNPVRAGKAYAINVVGCILGPLVAGFVLLPALNEKWSLIVLTVPWLIVGVAPLWPGSNLRFASRLTICTMLAAAVAMIALGAGYEDQFHERVVLRDPTATVIATGTGMDKRLLVNGFGMTNLTPITKIMAHFPLAFLDRPPQNALVICFGMGTTFRSLRSWGIPVTAVELVPSVPRLFGYYHSDGEAVLQSPLSHVVIDDGRRYLERTDQQYDVITIDPPPPLRAAASSLLYSEEFYQVARRRLRPGGILQQWLPANVNDDAVDVSAVSGSLSNSFPYVRVFYDEFGMHYLASDQPIPAQTSQELLQRMPASAISDLVEWDEPIGNGVMDTAEDRLSDLLKGEISIDKLVAASPETPALTDDRPINEYFIMRKWLEKGHAQGADNARIQ
jgi:spermidine synthase